MKKLAKIFSVLLLASSIGVTYTILSFAKSLEEIDFFDEDEDEQE
jgi:hypothetical protein